MEPANTESGLGLQAVRVVGRRSQGEPAFCRKATTSREAVTGSSGGETTSQIWKVTVAGQGGLAKCGDSRCSALLEPAHLAPCSPSGSHSCPFNAYEPLNAICAIIRPSKD